MGDYSDPPEAVVERLRAICLALPDAYEQKASAGTRWMTDAEQVHGVVDDALKMRPLRRPPHVGVRQPPGYGPPIAITAVTGSVNAIPAAPAAASVMTIASGP